MNFDVSRRVFVVDVEDCTLPVSVACIYSAPESLHDNAVVVQRLKNKGELSEIYNQISGPVLFCGNAGHSTFQWSSLSLNAQDTKMVHWLGDILTGHKTTELPSFRPTRMAALVNVMSINEVGLKELAAIAEPTSPTSLIMQLDGEGDLRTFAVQNNRTVRAAEAWQARVRECPEAWEGITPMMYLQSMLGPDERVFARSVLYRFWQHCKQWSYLEGRNPYGLGGHPIDQGMFSLEGVYRTMGWRPVDVHRDSLMVSNGARTVRGHEVHEDHRHEVKEWINTEWTNTEWINTEPVYNT